MSGELKCICAPPARSQHAHLKTNTGAWRAACGGLRSGVINQPHKQVSVAVTSSPPLSPHTHWVTYQLAVDTTQADSRSADCNLYHAGAAFILLYSMSSWWNKPGWFQVRTAVGTCRFSCFYVTKRGNILPWPCVKKSSEGRNRRFKCSKISLTLTKGSPATCCLPEHTWFKLGLDFSQLFWMVSQHHGQRPRWHGLTSGAPSRHTNQEKALEKD